MDNIIMAIIICQIYVQLVEYILDDQTINSECVVYRSSSLTTTASRRRLLLVDNSIMAIVLSQTHIQAVEYILDCF